MKEYLTVPCNQGVLIEKKGSINDATAYFTEVINKQARAGWTYHSMEKIIVSQKQGCLGNRTATGEYYMLIFERNS